MSMLFTGMEWLIAYRHERCGNLSHANNIAGSDPARSPAARSAMALEPSSVTQKSCVCPGSMCACKPTKQVTKPCTTFSQTHKTVQHRLITQ